MKKHGYVEGTGNVYADLGVVNPQEARAKADLAHRIVDIIEARKLTQVQAGKVLGVDQPKVSALKRGRLTDFSIERLVGFLLLLGHDVLITVTPKPHSSRKPPTLEVNAMGRLLPLTAKKGFHERDGRERPHVDKNPAYAVNPESERAENRDVLTWDLVNSRFARLKCYRARTAFQEEHKANKNLPAVLPAVDLSCNDFQ
jgi:predicted XRE-type DNA-binding protein